MLCYKEIRNLKNLFSFRLLVERNWTGKWGLRPEWDFLWKHLDKYLSLPFLLKHHTMETACLKLCTYTYLFFKHKAKVSKHITNRGSSLKLLGGVSWLEESPSAVTANFFSNHQQTLVHVALAGCWFSPLSHMTQSHKGQRHVWRSKKTSPHYAFE